MLQWIALLSRVEEFLRGTAKPQSDDKCDCDQLAPCVKEFESDSIRVLVREVLHDCGHIGYWIEVLYVPEKNDRTPVSIATIRDGDLHNVAQLLTKAAEYLDYHTADSFDFELVDD